MVRIKGFTLIELLLVIVIVAISAAVVAPNIGSGNQTAKLNSAARDIASALRFARGRALSQHKESTVLFNLQDNTYQITDKAKLYRIAKEIAITLDIAQSQIIDEIQGRIRFFPDGSSTGGRVTLVVDANQLQLNVNWLTGLVEIDDK